MNDYFLYGFLTLLGIGFGALFLVLPIVAAVKAGRARREAGEAKREVVSLRLDLEILRRQLATAPPVRAEPIVEPAAVIPLVAEAAPTPTPEAPLLAIPVETTPPPPAATSPASFEEKVALIWFTRIGAGALLLGVAYFFKYAVDNNWIGPWGRVALGALAGCAVLAFAELTRPRTRPIWTMSTLGVGLGLLLLTAYASHAFYHLVPVLAAFAAFFVVSLLGGVLAIHHKAEAILILSLSAALSAPVLLSTGEDRPFALFGYLLVVTALSHAASLKMQFRWSLWLGVAGTAALFIGWYGTFFDAHPAPLHPTVDLPLDQLEGAYLHLPSRAIPLGFVLAFLAEWLVVYQLARTDRPRLWPVALLVAAALLAHVGFAALLYDHPLHLGGALTVLGVVSAFLLHREKKSELLAIPLLASFAVLIATVHAAAQTQPIGMLALLAVWASIYLVGFLRGPLTDGKPSARTLGLMGGVGLGFAILAAALLAHPHPIGFAAVIAALSMVYMVLGVSAQSQPLMGGAIGLSFAFLLTNMPQTGDAAGTDYPFIAVSAVWAAVYLAAVSYEWIVRRAPPTAGRLLVFSAAGLAFAFLAESHTVEGQGTLRACILATVGLIDLGLGALLLRRDPATRRPASVLLGQALGLFAAAAALLFTGATITLIWAALAAVVVWLAAGDRDRAWLSGGLALFGATVLRLLFIELPAPAQLQREFFNSVGKLGQLHPPFLANPRTYALAGAAVALLVAARACRALVDEPWFKRASIALFTLAHGALLILVVAEIHTIAQTLPLPPAGSDPGEFQVFITAYAEAIVGQRERLAMLTTLLMGLYASALVGYGFGAKDRTHRYLGLGLFVLTLAKLVLWDVWHLERVYQILVLVATGALLLGASFLYARLGKRLVAIVRDGRLGPVLLLLLAGAVSLAWSPRAQAIEPKDFSEMRPVEGITAPGFYKVEIDVDLYRHSRSDANPLADLRIVGPGGKEVPYLIRDVPVATPPVLHPAVLVDPVTLPDGTVRATLDLGRAGLKHSEVRLSVEGQDFLRRTRIEVSSDEASWAGIADGAIIYRIQTAATPSSQLVVRYPVSDARYLRVNLLPPAAHDAPSVRIAGGEVYWVQPASRPLVRAIEAKPDGSAADPNAKATRATFDLGEPGVPVQAVVLEIAGSPFERRAIVSASTHKTYWAPIGGGVLYRPVASMSLGGVQENVRLEVATTTRRYLQIEILDGDDPPLHVPRALGEYRVQELVLRADQAGSHLLYLGSSQLAPPAYDLAAVLQRSGEVAIADAHMGGLEPNPQFGSGAGAAAGQRPASERHPLAIRIALSALLAGLAAFTLYLLRRSKKA